MSASGVTAWLCFLSQHALYRLTVMTVLAEWVKMYAFNTTQGKKVDLLGRFCFAETVTVFQTEIH